MNFAASAAEDLVAGAANVYICACSLLIFASLILIDSFHVSPAHRDFFSFFRFTVEAIEDQLVKRVLSVRTYF